MEKFFAAITKTDQDVMLKAQEATKAALIEYFHGSIERSIPLLQRSIELDQQQLRAFAGAWERAGIPDWDQMEATYAQLFAVSHGRLARAYFLTSRRDECLNHLALAVDFGTKSAAEMRRQSTRESALKGLAEMWGMESQDRVFALLQRYDETDRQHIPPAQRDDAGRPPSGNQYMPGRANCLLESDARQRSPRAPQQGR